MRDSMTIAFQLKQGIVMKAKYINDKTNGVMAVNKEKSM